MSQYRKPGTQHDKAGQVLILRAQAVREPRSHRGTSGELLTAIQQKERRFMIRTVRVHRPDHAKIVGQSPELREDLTHFQSAFSITLELEGRLEEIAGLSLRR